jgi:O-antigen/teichoic acid export membrane protein
MWWPGPSDRFSLRRIDIPAREVFAFTIPLLSSDLVYIVMNTSDVVLLGYFRDSAEVGAFRAIWPAAHLNLMVMTSFALLFTPLAARFFARQDRERMNELYWQTAIWVAVFTFPVFALTFALAEPLTVTLFGERYADSAPYLALLSLGYYFSAALGLNGLTLKVFGKLKYIVSINLLAVVVNVGLNLVLIPRYGALGAAIGTTGTVIAHNVLKQIGLRLGTGISLFQRSHARVYATIVLSAAGLLLAQLLLEPGFVAGLTLATLACLAVLAASRRSLRVGHTFPELMRFRLVRLLVGKDGGQ